MTVTRHPPFRCVARRPPLPPGDRVRYPLFDSWVPPSCRRTWPLAPCVAVAQCLYREEWGRHQGIRLGGVLQVDLGTPVLGAQPYSHRGVVSGRLGCRDEGSRCVMGAGGMVETDDRRGGSRQRLSAGLLALVQGSAFLGLAMAGLALLVVPVLVPALAVLGVVAMVGLPPTHGLVLALALWA